jgi:hypothetical protein
LERAVREPLESRSLVCGGACGRGVGGFGRSVRGGLGGRRLLRVRRLRGLERAVERAVGESRWREPLERAVIESRYRDPLDSGVAASWPAACVAGGWQSAVSGQTAHARSLALSDGSLSDAGSLTDLSRLSDAGSLTNLTRLSYGSHTVRALALLTALKRLS